MMKAQIYNLYKPLRNHLKPVNLEKALYVIWAYSNYLQFNCEFPADIQVNKIITDGQNNYRRFISEWELSLLTREVIVNSQEITNKATENFQNYKYFSAAIDKIKDFENNLSGIYVNSENILTEIRRIAYRQFPWQQKPCSEDFVRYYKIFNNPRLKTTLEDKLKLSIQQWYTVGTAITGAFLTKPRLYIDPEIEIGGVTKKHFDLFIDFVSSDFKKIKTIIDKDVNYDDQYIYAFNPLEYYPVIKTNKYYLCPLLTFLIWRMTSGIYFDLVNEKNFGNNYGLAFQDYIDEISKIILKGSDIELIPEQEYCTNSKTVKKSVDFILRKNNAAFFIEAKTKRIQSRAKTQLLSNEAIEKDLNILAVDILQIYKTIKDYKNNSYTHFKFNESITIHPLLVTLEGWYLFREDLNTLKEKVKEEMIKAELPLNYLDEMPYTICSIKNYENLLQVINILDIETVMENWHKPEYIGHSFESFLHNNYSNFCKSLVDYFPNDFENIYSNLNLKQQLFN